MKWKKMKQGMNNGRKRKTMTKKKKREGKERIKEMQGRKVEKKKVFLNNKILTKKE